MAVVNAGSDNFSSYIADASEEFSWAPEVSFAEVPAQPGMLAEKFKGAASFKQLKCFGHAHRRWQSNKQMNVVRLNLELVNFHVVRFRDFIKKLFAMFANNVKFKWVFRILRFPHQVIRVLSNAVSVMFKPFHFGFPPRFLWRAHATSFVDDGCASLATHPFYFSTHRKSLRRLGTRAKARGILCM